METEPWSLAEALSTPMTAPETPASSFFPPTPNLASSTAGQSAVNSNSNSNKVRFNQQTTVFASGTVHTVYPGGVGRGTGFGNNYSSGSNSGSERQGSEELLETLSRALARRVFELHRGAKNKQRMKEKQLALSQAK